MPEIKLISPADLLINPENPRLPTPNLGQRDALRGLATHMGRKLLALANDIVQFGLNPADLSIVMPSGDDTKRYLALEGNRRLAALKILENPEIIVGAVDASTVDSIRRAGREYQNAPIEAVQCLVVADESEADHWIELRHTGQNEGAGIVPWGSDEVSRYRARTGKLEVHSQALDFLENRGLLKLEDRRKIPAASLRRLLSTPAVRAKLGIDVEKRTLRFIDDEDRIASALMSVINDLISSAIKTADIYTSKQREEFAKKLPDIKTVSPATSQAQASPAAPAATPRRQPIPRRRERDVLIPRDCTLKIDDLRIREIEDELRTLSLDSFKNAISVLFRVFLELSVDSYTTRRSLSVPKDATLGNKTIAVLNDLLAQQKLTRQQAAPVRRACQKDSFLAPSITMMHQYVHNRNFFPAAGDLRANWNNLQPFVMAIWPI